MTASVKSPIPSAPGGWIAFCQALSTRPSAPRREIQPVKDGNDHAR